jgi:serine/threonine-protein kinase
MELAADLTPDRVREALRRIVASAGFSAAPALRQLLEYTVETTLSGRAAEIKESTIAIDVFGRKSSFDPRSDPIVRVQARKLRDRIAAWYETDGVQDEVIIEYVRGSYVPRFALRGVSQIRQRSIAVLPFVNLSDTSALEYLCDGIAEELRYLLIRVHGIRVIAHASAQVLRGTTEDVRAIGRLLNADLLIRGTVRSSGPTVRITAELIEVEDGFLVWAERWDRADGDLLGLQNDIAAAVAGALRSQVAPPAASVSSTHDLEAHQLYLKGRFYWNQRTQHGFGRAIEHYEAALRRDPRYARAYAALADTWTLIAAHHLEKSEPCLARARECAARAVSLDPKLAAAHSALASTLLLYERKPREAERAWKEALKLDPFYAYAWHGYSVFGSFVWPGSPDSLACIRQAQRLEPLSAPIACDVGFTLYAAGQFEEAIEACHAAIDLHPAFSRTYVCLARCRAALGDFEAAVQSCIRGRPLFTGRAFLGQLLATQAFSYACLGRVDEALAILRELEEDAAEHFVASMDRAVIYTGLGHTERAIDLLERANDEREFWAIAIPAEPLLRPLHREPRFQALASRVFNVVPASR